LILTSKLYQTQYPKGDVEVSRVKGARAVLVHEMQRM